MKRFKEVILEAKSVVPIKTKFPLNKLKEFYPDYSIALDNFKNGKKVQIYRGDSSVDKSKCVIISPQDGYRKSRNTYNFYTLVIDNSEPWSAFPKRSKSVICSISEKYAAGYDWSTIFLLFPKNDAKIAICPKRDIWDSTKYGINGMSSINDTISVISGIVKVSLLKDQENFEVFKEKLKLISKKILIMKYAGEYQKFLNKLENSFYTYNRVISKELYEYIDEDHGVYEFLLEIWDPDKNGFELYSTSEFYKKVPRCKSGDGRECWISNDCLLIGISKLKKIKGALDV